jgi:hypothetical protein
MTVPLLRSAGLGLALSLAISALAVADEADPVAKALETSKKTGMPVLAVAGSKT